MWHNTAIPLHEDDVIFDVTKNAVFKRSQTFAKGNPITLQVNVK